MNTFGKKQPGESYRVAFDFANVIPVGDAIATATVTAIDLADGTSVTDTILTGANQVIESPKVYVWIKAGTTAHNYKITCVIVTNSSPAETYELDARLPVMEI